MLLSIILLIAYPIIIKFKRAGLYKLLAIPAILFLVLDVIANYTEVSFIFGWPKKGDYTISQRLRTMQESDPLQSRRDFAKAINTYLHAMEDDGKH